jgi:hypothetical protein
MKVLDISMERDISVLTVTAANSQWSLLKITNLYTRGQNKLSLPIKLRCKEFLQWRIQKIYGHVASLKLLLWQ